MKIMNSLSVKTVGVLFLSFIFTAFSSEVILAKTSSSYKHNYRQDSSGLLLRKLRQSIAQEKTSLNESSFTIENYPIEHQGKNTLDIRIDYRQKDNQKSATIFQEQTFAHQLHQLIFNYPNETDFWEVLNYQLTQELLAQNPNLSSISITLAVYPNQEFPYYRASTVTRTDNGQIEESWHFNFRSSSMENADKNPAYINVNYTYKTHAFSHQYPDFIPIYQQIEYFLANQTYARESWLLIDRKLTQMLLQENPQISSLSLELE